MRRGAWVHQFTQLSEGTVDEIAATLLPRGITTVYIKACDGGEWMGDFYAHPLAPTDAGRLADLVAAFAAAGLELIPWVVPRYSSAEVDVHLSAAEAADGRLVIDWEYQYKGFWQGIAFEARLYWDRLRQAVKDGLWIAAAPDPRQVGRDYSADLISEVSAYLPQTYWTDFQQDALIVLTRAFNTMQALGPFEPILPYNSSPADMEAALGWCYGKGLTAVSLWRLGSADAQQLDAFAQRVPGEEDAEVPDCEAAEKKAADLVNALGYIAGDVLKPLTRKNAAAYVKKAVDQIRAIADQQGVTHA